MGKRDLGRLQDPGKKFLHPKRYYINVLVAHIISHNHINIFSPLCNTVFENFWTTTRLVLQVTSFRFFEMTLRSAKGLELGLPSWSNLKIIHDNSRKCIRSFWVLHFVALWGLAPEHWHTSLHRGKATVLNRQKCVRLEPPKNHQTLQAHILKMFKASNGAMLTQLSRWTQGGSRNSSGFCCSIHLRSKTVPHCTPQQI